MIGLQALAKLAERISSSDVDISVVFSYSGGSPTKMKVNKANAMILQKQEVGVTSTHSIWQWFVIVTHIHEENTFLNKLCALVLKYTNTTCANAFLWECIQKLLDWTDNKVHADFYYWSVSVSELWNSVSATSGNTTRTDVFVTACRMSVVVPEFQVDFGKDAFMAAM